MKKIVLVLAALSLAIASAVSAQAATATANISMTYRSTVGATADQNLAFKVSRIPAKAGVYSAADLGFRSAWNASLITPAQFQVTSDASSNVALTVPVTVQLTDGSGNTATLGLDAWGSSAAAPSAPAGAYTSGTSVATSGTGKYFLAVTPSTLSFDQDVPGASWAGTAQVVADYID